jgi:D-3-phosphoglycerate dehydrogenase/(S)-sulfolactate dehydrogenase
VRANQGEETLSSRKPRIDPADVVVAEDVWGPPLARLAADLHVARQPDAWRDADALARALAGARALVVRNRTQVTSDLLEACPELRVVARAGVGLDNIDVAAADDLGVVVVAALGANAVSVAEHTLALALALARRILPLDRDCRAGGWNRSPGRELAGGTWGLLGAGATGRACARLARALGMRVVAYDPYLSSEHPTVSELDIRFDSLPAVLAGSDVVSCHLPATDETRGLIGAELLGAMRPHALLVSVGRGDVIDEEALADALESRRLGGAGLDVRAHEPPAVGRLEQLDNVVLTPHVAGITAESQDRILEILADDIRTVLSGREARYAVGRTAAAGRTLA